MTAPPTNSGGANWQAMRITRTIPSSMTRFVDAISKLIAAVKSAPLMKSERASATAAYEQEELAAPSSVASASERGESSGNSRLICAFDTTASTIADSVNPRIKAQRISQVIANEIERAWRTASMTVTVG